MLGSLTEAPSTQLISWRLLLNGKISFAIGGKTDQVLEWLWVFQPWFGKNKTVIGTFWTSEHLRGHWKCSKVFLSIQRKKKDLRQWKETESSTPFVVKAATSLFLNSLKFTWKALTFFRRETRGFKNFETTYDESWNWNLSPFANYASWSHEQINRWRNLTADAKIETKIRHDTICPLILSREFWFCLLMQIAQIGTYESIFR